MGGALNSPKTEKKRWSMRIKLARSKQTVDGETEHNKKKKKMAHARKPEMFVWTDNEAKLLLRLTLNYKASKFRVYTEILKMTLLPFHYLHKIFCYQQDFMLQL